MEFIYCFIIHPFIDTTIFNPIHQGKENPFPPFGFDGKQSYSHV